MWVRPERGWEVPRRSEGGRGCLLACGVAAGWLSAVDLQRQCRVGKDCVGAGKGWTAARGDGGQKATLRDFRGWRWGACRSIQRAGWGEMAVYFGGGCRALPLAGGGALSPSGMRRKRDERERERASELSWRRRLQQREGKLRPGPGPKKESARAGGGSNGLPRD